ncbi:hypothetical protein JN085_04545 [Mycolicibacterium austroafricanum]|nr:hypothetical protein JN085_04545 [Mycolicibacterium austroafricanum]
MVRDLRGDATSAWGAMGWAADLLVIGLFRNSFASIGQGCRSAHFGCTSATSVPGPMLNRTCDAIEAHLTVVVTALAVAHNTQECTDLDVSNLTNQVQPLGSAIITINGAAQTFPPAITDTERKILTDLGFNPGY